MSKTVELSRDEAEGLVFAAILQVEEHPQKRTTFFAAEAALKIADAFGMGSQLKEQLRP